MNQVEVKDYKEIPREDRIILAHSYYGWYTFGLAMGESQRIDENCAMDNAGVPIYEHQLTDKHKEVLKKHKKLITQFSESPTGLFDKNGSLDVFALASRPAAIARKRIEETNAGLIHQATPITLSADGALQLSRIIAKRRAAVRRNIANESNKQWEMYSWYIGEDGMQAESFVISQHASEQEASAALDIHTAHLIYADILLLQEQQAKALRDIINTRIN